MMPTVRHGWLQLPYDGPEIGILEIKVGHVWYDAFLDYDENGNRIAQIRWHGRPVEAEVRCRHPEPQVPGAEVGPTQPGSAA